MLFIVLIFVFTLNTAAFAMLSTSSVGYVKGVLLNNPDLPLEDRYLLAHQDVSKYLISGAWLGGGFAGFNVSIGAIEPS